MAKRSADVSELISSGTGGPVGGLGDGKNAGGGGDSSATGLKCFVRGGFLGLSH
jgi:hypothetical protein